MNEVKAKVLKICNDSKKASSEIAMLDSAIKDQVLLEVVKLLKKHTQKIIKANQKDVKIAKEQFGYVQSIIKNIR